MAKILGGSTYSYVTITRFDKRLKPCQGSIEDEHQLGISVTVINLFNIDYLKLFIDNSCLSTYNLEK